MTKKQRPERFAWRGEHEVRTLPDFDLSELPPIDSVDLSNDRPPPLPKWAALS